MSTLDPRRWRARWLALDKDPEVVRRAQTPAGMLLLHAAFLALLFLAPRVRTSIALAAAGVLALCALWPARRVLWIGSSGLVLLLVRPFRAADLESVPGAVARALPGAELPLELWARLAAGLVLGLGALALVAQRRWPKSLLARRPVACLLACVAALLCLAEARVLARGAQVFLWTLIPVLVSSLWFLAYALHENRGKDATSVPLRLGFLRAFWGGTTTPFGKGPAYLARFAPAGPADLAVTRLKALKLILWCVLLGWLWRGLELAAARVHWPSYAETLARHFAGGSVSLGQAWGALLHHYTLDLLQLATFGHGIVAMVRMSGFRIPRNTVRPLEARTLAEFWNRYYFYFKELLVDFFFFPTFLRHFKTRPKLRLAWATFVAAGVGNFLYHFLANVHLVASHGLLGALRAFATYAFYTFVLASALALSQARPRTARPAGFLRGTFLPCFQVALFFALLGLFDDTSGQGSLLQRLAFLPHLLGLGR